MKRECCTREKPHSVVFLRFSINIHHTTDFQLPCRFPKDDSSTDRNDLAQLSSSRFNNSARSEQTSLRITPEAKVMICFPLRRVLFYFSMEKFRRTEIRSFSGETYPGDEGYQGISVLNYSLLLYSCDLKFPQSFLRHSRVRASFEPSSC